MNRSVKKLEAREGDKNQCKYTLEDLLFSFYICTLTSFKILYTHVKVLIFVSVVFIYE